MVHVKDHESWFAGAFRVKYWLDDPSGKSWRLLPARLPVVRVLVWREAPLFLHVRVAMMFLASCVQ